MFTLCRAIYLAPDCGLGAAWSSSGDVCEQPSQWTDHLRWTDPSEQMVGTQWFCWHSVCYNFCTHPLSEQVFRRLLIVHLHFDALNVWAWFQNYNQYFISPSEVLSQPACMDITASWLVFWWRFSQMQGIGTGGYFFPISSCQWHGEFISLLFSSFTANLDLYQKRK